MLSKLINIYGQKRSQFLLFILLVVSGSYLAFVFVHDGSDKLTLYKVIYGVIWFIELSYLAFGKKATTSSKSSIFKAFLKVLIIVIGITAVILAVLTAIFVHRWKFV